MDWSLSVIVPSLSVDLEAGIQRENCRIMFSVWLEPVLFELAVSIPNPLVQCLELIFLERDHLFIVAVPHQNAVSLSISELKRLV